MTFLLCAPSSRGCFCSAFSWGGSPLLPACLPPHCPRVSRCSCHLWLICHRRKQCTDWDATWKHVAKKAERTWTTWGHVSWPDGPEFYTCLYNLGLGGKSRQLKQNASRSLNIVSCFSCIYSSNMPWDPNTRQTLRGTDLQCGRSHITYLEDRRTEAWL